MISHTHDTQTQIIRGAKHGRTNESDKIMEKLLEEKIRFQISNNKILYKYTLQLCD